MLDTPSNHTAQVPTALLPQYFCAIISLNFMQNKTRNSIVGGLAVVLAIAYCLHVNSSNSWVAESTQTMWQTLERCLILSVVVERVTWMVVKIVRSRGNDALQTRLAQHSLETGDAKELTELQLPVGKYQSDTNTLTIAIATTLAVCAAFGRGNIVGALLLQTAPNPFVVVIGQKIVSGLFIASLSLLVSGSFAHVQTLLNVAMKKLQTNNSPQTDPHLQPGTISVERL